MKILVVDDEAHILDKLPKAFTKFYPKAIVDTAWTYLQAEKLLKENVYNLILLDGQLLDFKTEIWQHAFGYCLSDPIRKSSSKDAKIIMISGDKSMRRQGISEGADFGIDKNLFFKNEEVVNSLNLEFKLSKGL